MSAQTQEIVLDPVVTQATIVKWHEIFSHLAQVGNIEFRMLNRREATWSYPHQGAKEAPIFDPRSNHAPSLDLYITSKFPRRDLCLREHYILAIQNATAKMNGRIDYSDTLAGIASMFTYNTGWLEGNDVRRTALEKLHGCTIRHPNPSPILPELLRPTRTGDLFESVFGR